MTSAPFIAIELRSAWVGKEGRPRMRLLWAILVLFSLSNIAQGQTLPEAEPTVEKLLRQVKDKKDLATQEMAQLPDPVEGEVGRIMTELDTLLREHLQDRFDEHYKEVKQSLLAVSLPENVNSLKVTGEQLKAVLEAILEFLGKQRKVRDDSSDLDTLVKDFVLDAQETLEPQHEQWAKYIDAQLDETLTADELPQAQDTIRGSFQKILRQHFPVWDVPDLHAPPLSALSGVQGKGRPVVKGVPIGLAGLGLLSKNVVRKKVVAKVIKKLLVKVGARAAATGASGPFALILLGPDALGTIQAKANLEHNLREQFSSMYKEKVSPTTIWDQPVEEGSPPIRHRFAQEVRRFLQDWTKHCRGEVERILDAARVFGLSPNAQNYITEQTKKGRNTKEIVEDMHWVGEMFGEGIIAKVPLGRLTTVSDKVVDIVNRAYQKSPEAAQAFLSQWPVRTWERYRDDPDRFKALLAVAAYRLTERNQTARDFAREIDERDELTPIFVDVDLCGVRLWDTYAGPAVGRHQREKAENAIDLLKKKYPCDVLQTPEGLAEVQLYHRLTFGGAPEAFQMVRPFWKIVYVGTTVLVILLVAVPAMRMLRKQSLSRRDVAK